MLMANAVTELALRTSGKEAIAMESFAKALRQLPTAIADNAGYDSADLISQLRAAHTEGKSTYGLGMLIVVNYVLHIAQSAVFSKFLTEAVFGSTEIYVIMV
mgnify:CR=1 FL=1